MRATPGLADLPELRTLLASDPGLPDEPEARAAFERAAKWLFETSDRLVQLIVALRMRPNAN